MIYSDGEILEIRQNKSRVFTFFLGSMGFVLIAVFFLIYFYNQSNSISEFLIDYFITNIALLITIIFFGYGAIFFLKQMTSQPLVKLDKEGLYDHSTAFGYGFIPWNNIDSIYVYTLEINYPSTNRMGKTSVNMIAVKLKDKEIFLNNLSSKLKIYNKACNEVNKDDSIMLSVGTANVDINEACNKINEFRNKFGV